MESKKNNNIFILNVKRGLYWSERKVEITIDNLQYFNKDELRFKTNIQDVILTEKNAKNTKEYSIKITSKTK
jgi:hypothetical protein